MSTLDPVLRQITDNLDQRRLEMTKLRRVVLGYVGMPLETTAVNMAIPMVYAHWEGYVKEVCELYLEHVESAVPCCAQLQPALLGYLWTPVLRPLTGGINCERQKAVASQALQSLGAPVIFSDAEKAIDAKANLNYSVLEGIAALLCIDTSGLGGWKAHLDSLVHIRNNIAHGSPPTAFTYSDFETRASATMALMEDFEQVVVAAIRNKTFRTI